MSVTRWEASGSHGYGARFAALIEAGTDIHGEARLVDVLAPRGGVILDAGSGMGRVAAGLQQRGFQVTAVEKDPALIEQSRSTYPDVAVVAADLVDLSPELLREHQHPDTFDVVVAVGNVLIFLAPETERQVLRNFGSVLRDGGRVVVGFHTEYSDGAPSDVTTARSYSPSQFEADVAAAGLVVQQRFGSYDLLPPADDYCVYVLSKD